MKAKDDQLPPVWTHGPIYWEPEKNEDTEEEWVILSAWAVAIHLSFVFDTGAHISQTSNSNQDLQSHPHLPAILRFSDSHSIAWITLWFLQIADGRLHYLLAFGISHTAPISAIFL